MIKILLVEDQPIMMKLFKAQLERHQYVVDQAATFQSAAQKVEQGNYDVILLDLQLPDGNGIHLFDRHPEKLESRTIIITANATLSSAVEAIKKGAFNYLEKPIEEELLTTQVKKVVELNRLERRYQSIKTDVTSNYVFEDIVYGSGQMEEIIRRAKILAKTDNAILIQGETGVGKEVLSCSIHNYSLRKGEVFLPINCAAIPPELFESELFGFSKGAFTGAVNTYSGRFLQADKGTLFLDEIGELPLHIQAKLLRIMDEKVIYPLKSKKALKVNIRLISATNKNLSDEVNLKQFRSDLYYRLKEASLVIPPLRERPEDILELTRHFIRIYNNVYNKNITKVSKKAEKFLLNYSWKGNVRELKNTIKSIIPFKKNGTIDLDDLSHSIIEGKEMAEHRLLTLEEHEKKYILKVLKATNFNISQAANVLGINRPRLYRKIKHYQLFPKSPLNQAQSPIADGIEKR
ncbi:MAG: sigma-54-dependent Fis family transcriptional regulator [Candidatus Aminicenantes bacterium]|nr:MAG: sigma-54-dependent Fis family transcriptional regulator [Candidatus Aminicenantes bacterium]